MEEEEKTSKRTIKAGLVFYNMSFLIYTQAGTKFYTKGWQAFCFGGPVFTKIKYHYVIAALHEGGKIHLKQTWHMKIPIYEAHESASVRG